jgi:hypothetical protein
MPGYRHVDLPQLLRDDQRTLGMFVLPIVTRCLAGLALQALNHQHTTLAEMWQKYETMIHPLGLRHHAVWFIGRLESSEATMRRTWGEHRS